MRARLRQLGIDPDRLTGEPVNRQEPANAKTEDVAEQLEKLREQRDSGTITEEEYEHGRERLRRY